MHRFQPERRLDFVKRMQEKNLYSSISIGVKEEEFALVDKLAKANLIPDYITIDIAHGHSNAVIDMIQYIKKIYLIPLLSLVTLVLLKQFVSLKMLVLMLQK